MLEWIERLAQAISEVVSGVLQPSADFLGRYVWAWPEQVPLLAVILLLTGIYVTIRLGFIQIRGFKHAIDIVRGAYDDPKDDGDLKHYQALTTALSATVGIGNIAGVAIAIRLGGPGAIFWMWCTAFLGMALKFVECTLAIKFRKVHKDGSVSGGPMYYMEMGLGKKWKWMAISFAVFAVICSFATGNMNQSNTMADAMRDTFGIHPIYTAMVFAALVGIVIVGGIRRIGRVTSILAPGMAALYVGSALLILLFNFGSIPSSLALIVKEAFNPSAAVGGGTASFLITIMWGIRRGLFSNEAGQGSAPIAHAAAKTDEPVREGLVASLGPFIDTLVICTMTALVILTTGSWKEKTEQTFSLAQVEAVVQPAGAAAVPVDKDLLGLREARGAGQIEVRQGVPVNGGFVVLDAFVEGAQVMDDNGVPWTGALSVAADGSITGADSLMTSIEGKALLTAAPLTTRGFEIGLGGLAGRWIVTFAVLLFAVSTAISWSYYGDRATEYLFGARAIPVYRWLYVGFFFIGAILPLQAVWDFGDVALGLMSFPNLIAVVLLSGTAVKLTKDYYSREHKPFK